MRSDRIRMHCMTESGPGGGLRNTIYRRITRSGRRMTVWRRMLYALAVPLGLGIIRLLVAHLPGGARRGRGAPGRRAREGAVADSVLLAPASALLRRSSRRPARRAGCRSGWLISPSVDGELGAMMVQPLWRARDSRLLDQHRRARAAGLLRGAHEGERVARHHAGWPARTAVRIQAGRHPARADVADGRFCRWRMPPRARGSSSGTSS